MRRITEIIVKTCPYCNKEYECLNSSTNKRRKYCSRFCTAKAALDGCKGQKYKNKPHPRAYDNSGYHKCSKCHITKGVQEFNYNKRNTGKISGVCKDCVRVATSKKKKHLPSDISHKTCSVCNTNKTIDNFSYCKNSVGGYRLKCKNCFNKARMEKLRVNYDARIVESLRKRIRSSLGTKHLKTSGSGELLGCSTEHLRQRLELQFDGEMSWENYGIGGWHIDHILPCSAFNMSDPTEQKMCFHYSNLQPMWASDNIAKSDKYDEKELEEYKMRFLAEQMFSN